MKSLLLFLLFVLGVYFCHAQFPPPVGQQGTTAIHKDSSVFVAWASQCVVVRGPQNIADIQSDTASAGEAWMATGVSGVNGTVSLGDNGYAVLTFDSPIYNGDGWDFAIFENGFSNDFLELAFVEVSDDGINYYRFPATSLTQDTLQIGSFGTLDATKINNLAGKYRGGYGTPFDLDELSHLPLNIDAITHVKIIDVVGSISPLYGTYDQYGNIINDPFPTSFPSGGFDLDAVGVIHGVNAAVNNASKNMTAKVYPNPASTYINVQFEGNLNSSARLTIRDVFGKTLIMQENIAAQNSHKIIINTAELKSNFYILGVETSSYITTEKILIINE